MNVVPIEIIEKPSRYIYSGASNYVLDSGLLKIGKADFPIVFNLYHLSNIMNLKFDKVIIT